jgi:hypothetical protein
VIKNDRLAMRYMRPDEMLMVSLFQYMIGNSDYSVTGRHNLKIIAPPGFNTEGYTPVPYDFDYTGLVDAVYAVPGEDLGIKDIKQRYYLGPCREDQEYLEVIGFMEQHREEILEFLHEFPYLEEKDKREVIGYIEEYYMMASGKGFINRELKSTCR